MLISNFCSKNLSERQKQLVSDVSSWILICCKVPDSCQAYWNIERSYRASKARYSIASPDLEIKAIVLPKIPQSKRSAATVGSICTLQENYGAILADATRINPALPHGFLVNNELKFNTDFEAMQGKADPARSTDLQGVFGIWGERCRKILGGTGATERA
jgi:hypothetical protein